MPLTIMGHFFPMSAMLYTAVGLPALFIAESIEVCAKALIEDNSGHSNPSFLLNSQKNCLEKGNIDSSR